MVLVHNPWTPHIYSTHSYTTGERSFNSILLHHGMGNKTTKMSGAPLTPEELRANNDGKVYALKKRRPGCTGMFWRQDPSNSGKLTSNADWPRDGATLRGCVYDKGGIKGGDQWLIVSHVKQAGGTWKLAPAGAAMPFEYDNHYYLEQVE